MDYKAGDLVVYGGSSCVCRIVKITRLDMPSADKEKLYYVLKPLNQDCVIYNPVDNTDILMRPIITRDNAQKLIDMIPGIKAEPYQSNELGETIEHYKSVIKTRDCAKLIVLAMNIYSKKELSMKHKRKFSSQEDMFRKQAEDMLFWELSVALDIPKEQVKSYITMRVSEQQND
jgi:CarD family transcriptional regulator